jgi:heat shock protein 5
MISYIAEDIKKKHSIDVSDKKKIMGKIRQECEKAKRLLSANLQATVEIDSIGSGIDYVVSISRAKFEEINDKLFRKTIPPVEQALKDAGWKISDVDDVVLVGGSTRIPKVQQLLKDKFNGKELSKSINPDEAVAHGATLQAGVLMGKNKTKDLLILDLTPLSFGLETVGGVFSTVIPRNTLIPAKKQQIFSTASDNQDTVDINVFEGERTLAKDNHFLGHFFLRNIPLAPRGVPQIEVMFEVDANGILTVTARDMASGNKGSINITADKRRLSEAEIQKMVQEAEDNKVKDQELKEKIEARSGLENYIYSLRSQVNDEKAMGAKLSEEEKKTILDTLNEKVKWIEDNKESAAKEDFEEQKAAVEKIVGPIVSKLYESGAATGADKFSEHEDL